MTLVELHYFIAAAVLTLLGKIVWDWLVSLKQKKENGHIESALERLEVQQGRNSVTLEEMHERQKKMWERMLTGGDKPDDTV